jgi:hypothetical protein
LTFCCPLGKYVILRLERSVICEGADQVVCKGLGSGRAEGVIEYGAVSAVTVETRIVVSVFVDGGKVI